MDDICKAVDPNTRAFTLLSFPSFVSHSTILPHLFPSVKVMARRFILCKKTVSDLVPAFSLEEARASFLPCLHSHAYPLAVEEGSLEMKGTKITNQEVGVSVPL